MPFTLAHPAAVLPLRGRLWLPALIAGSLAPDAGYYAPIGIDGALTHEARGLPLTLALGAVLLVLGRILCLPVPALLGRAVAFPARPGWWRVIAALIVGAATHLAWDTFTHTDGAAVRHWEPLRESVIGPHRVYNVIGYLSSLTGLIILAWFAARRIRRARPAPVARHRGWVLSGLALAAVAGGIAGATDPASVASHYDLVRCVLIGAVRAGGAAFLGYAVIVSGRAELAVRRAVAAS
ncbi:DUF4184 family protein [Nocardia sp. NPDC057668]|uniref:DUF4184 family protein n=1 Tax=Nocardia sp. NPDC057668 TaxID=3346202 RepID=UPI00366FDCB2